MRADHGDRPGPGDSPHTALASALRAVRERVNCDPGTAALVDTALEKLQGLNAEHTRLRRLIVDILTGWDANEAEQMAVRRRIREELRMYGGADGSL